MRSPAPLPPLFGVLLVAAGLSHVPSAAQQSAAADGPDHVAATEDGRLRIAVRENVLGYDDPQRVTPEFLLSPDGLSMAYILEAGGKFTVSHNGVEGPPFVGIVTDSLRFSPDSRRLLYLATAEGKKYIVVDGALHEQFAFVEPGASFSPSGAHVGWVAANESLMQFAVVDGESKKAYDGIRPPGIVWSPDGEEYAYVATLEGLQSVVRGDEEGPFLESIVMFAWSRVGNHLGYVARQGDRVFVFYDGALVAEADAFGTDGFAFPWQAERWAIALRRGESWSLLLDGQEEGSYKNLAPGISFSDDGSHYAYVAGRGTGKFLVLDGEPQAEYSNFERFRFSPGGRRVCFVVVDEQGRRKVVLDGEPQSAFLEIPAPGVVFSASGEHYFYVGKNETESVVVLDGVPGTPAAGLGDVGPAFVGEHLVYSVVEDGKHVLVVDGVRGEPRLNMRGVTFSPDGERSAYWHGTEGDWTLVVDGQEHAKYPYAPGAPVFSPDGRRLAFVAGSGRRVFVVLDGEEGAAHDFVGPRSLVFTPDGEHLAYCAGTADRRYVVVDGLVVDNGYSGFKSGESILALDDRHLSVRASRRGVWLLIGLEIL